MTFPTGSMDPLRGKPTLIASVDPSGDLVAFCRNHPDDAARFLTVAAALVPYAVDIPGQEVTAQDWTNWIKALENGAVTDR